MNKENRPYFNFRIMMSAVRARGLGEREAFRILQRWDWSLALNGETVLVI